MKQLLRKESELTFVSLKKSLMSVRKSKYLGLLLKKLLRNIYSDLVVTSHEK